MKRWLLFVLPGCCSFQAFATNVKGPDGYAFLGILLTLLIPVLIYFFARWLKNRKSNKSGGYGLFYRNNLSVSLEKNKLYFPDYIRLSVRNTGKNDIDIDRPLVIFSHLFLQRKFRLKGTNSYHFYPLLLESGKVHDLNIDLNLFYRHDAYLKKFPKVTVSVKSVDGRFYASKSVKIRKTLFG